MHRVCVQCCEDINCRAHARTTPLKIVLLSMSIALRLARAAVGRSAAGPCCIARAARRRSPQVDETNYRCRRVNNRLARRRRRSAAARVHRTTTKAAMTAMMTTSGAWKHIFLYFLRPDKIWPFPRLHNGNKCFCSFSYDTPWCSVQKYLY
jgi:hypothetical protein